MFCVLLTIYGGKNAKMKEVVKVLRLKYLYEPLDHF